VVPALPKAKLSQTRTSAYKVLATLCGGCPENLQQLMQRLSDIVAKTTKVRFELMGCVYVFAVRVEGSCLAPSWLDCVC